MSTHYPTIIANQSSAYLPELLPKKRTNLRSTYVRPCYNEMLIKTKQDSSIVYLYYLHLYSFIWIPTAFISKTSWSYITQIGWSAMSVVLYEQERQAQTLCLVAYRFLRLCCSARRTMGRSLIPAEYVEPITKYEERYDIKRWDSRRMFQAKPFSFLTLSLAGRTSWFVVNGQSPALWEAKRAGLFCFFRA